MNSNCLSKYWDKNLSSLSNFFVLDCAENFLELFEILLKAYSTIIKSPSSERRKIREKLSQKLNKKSSKKPRNNKWKKIKENKGKK